MKYTYANMIDRKQNICWYIFLDLDNEGQIVSLTAKKLSQSQYAVEGFTEDEIYTYINEMKARRKEHGASIPPVHKKKVYPNDLCPCGSGMKYKKCCGKYR